MSVREYTIVTQDVNFPHIRNILNKYGITGYTILEHDGYYKGEPEKGLDIVIIDEGRQYSQILLETICEAIKTMNNQDSVYLVRRYLDLRVV
jgi:N12 class adenine-specific DNA methylase